MNHPMGLAPGYFAAKAKNPINQIDHIIEN